MQPQRCNTLTVKPGRKIGEVDACEPILTEVQAAEMLGCSPRTLAAHRLRGRGPAHSRLGRQVRYALSDVQAWQAARTGAADATRNRTA